MDQLTEHATCYYTCKLVPPALLARSGYRPRWLGYHEGEHSAAALPQLLSFPPLMCSYVLRLLAAGERLLGGSPPSARLVVPSGCDAMRRAGDALSVRFPGKVFNLQVPRDNDAGAVAALAEDLGRLENWLWPSEGPADPAPPGTATLPANGFSYPHEPRIGGLFLISGPLSDDGLLRLVHELGSHVSGVDSCTGPERSELLAGLGSPGLSHREIAQRLLAEAVCPRRPALHRRAYLSRRLDETGPAAVLYARLSFCDPGAYDCLTASRVAAERGLPYLEVEVGYPLEAAGPLRTRVEAFLETALLQAQLN